MDAAREAAEKFRVLELVHRYFRCLDARDGPGLSECLAEDLDSFHTFAGPQKGREAFLRTVLAELPGLELFQHYSTNHEITLDGDRAACRSYVYAQHVVKTPAGPDLAPGGGRYLHECVRRGGRWIIAAVRVDVTWASPALAQVYGAGRPPS